MKIWELEHAAKNELGTGAAWNAIMSAIENAADTLKVESGDEFEIIALASLESVLCDSTECSKADFAWFKAQGVRW